MEIRLVQGPMSILNKKFDMCAKYVASDITRDLVKASKAQFGIPSKCPILGNEVFCYHGEKVLTFSKAQARLMMLLPGVTDMEMRVNITHDTGNSCFEAISKFTRKF